MIAKSSMPSNVSALMRTDAGFLVSADRDSAQPQNPVCQPDCLGLCPQCGTNRNALSCECPPTTEHSEWASTRARIIKKRKVSDMPPLPKRRRSRARQNKRMAHTARSPILTTQCPDCGSQRVPHRACPTCGIYNGRQVTKPRRAAE